MSDKIKEAIDGLETKIKDSVEETVVNKTTEIVEKLDALEESQKTANTEVEEKLETLQKDIAGITTVNSPIIVAKQDKFYSVEEYKKAFPESKVDLGSPVAGKSISIVTKDSLSGTSITGSGVATQTPFSALEQANMWRKRFFVKNVGGTSSFNIPSISGITFVKENDQPANVNGAPAVGVSNRNAILERYTSRYAQSLENEQDLPGSDSEIIRLTLQAAGKIEGKAAVAAMKATDGITQAVNTGAAAALPTVEKVIGKLAEMKATLKSPYVHAGSMFVVSRQLMALLHQSKTNELNFDPKVGIYTLFGYGIEADDYLETGLTAGHVSAYFGDFSRGMIMGTTNNVVTERFLETTPGAITYFSHMRFKNVAYDADALVGLKTKA